MSEVLSRLNGGEFIGLVAVVMGCLTGMCGIVGGVWHSVRKVESEATLKRDMLSAGLSADEIVRVVSATAGDKVSPPLAAARG